MADSSKIGSVGFVPIKPVSSIHTLITDSGAPSDFIQAMRDAGVEVMLVWRKNPVTWRSLSTADPKTAAPAGGGAGKAMPVCFHGESLDVPRDCRMNSAILRNRPQNAYLYRQGCASAWPRKQIR